MARQSRWKQFADNFNSVYGTFTDAAKKIEIGKVSKQEFTGDDGQALQGDALAQARANALANIYTKYGDAEGGIRLQSSAAQLEGLNRTNRIGAATENDQIYVQGEGARRNLDASINASNASANASNSTANLNGLRATELQTTIDYNNRLGSIFTEAAGREFESPAAADEYIMTALRNSGLPPSVTIPAMENVAKFGTIRLGQEALRIREMADTAIRDGGLDGLVRKYDEVNDGFTLDIERPAPGLVYIYQNNPDGSRIRISEGVGRDAEAKAQEVLYGRITNPGSALAIAAGVLSYDQNNANLGNTNARTALVGAQTDDTRSATAFRDGVQTDQTRASIALDQAKTAYVGQQTEQLRAEIAGMNDMTPARRQEIIMTKLGDFMKGEAYIMATADEQAEMVNAFLNGMSGTASGWGIRPIQ